MSEVESKQQPNVRPTEKQIEASRKAVAGMAALMTLTTMKVGEPITQLHLNAIDHWLGKLMTSLPPMREIKITFDDKGAPKVENDGGLVESIKVDGKTYSAEQMKNDKPQN